jgi:hypothetical protein
MSRDRRAPRPQSTQTPVPFDSVEDAWFWFIQAYEQRVSGARIAANLGDLLRPCEPADLLREIDRLYRQRRLIRDHLLVLAHYGRRLLPPDPQRRLEARAYGLWCEAMVLLAPVLERKGIIAQPRGMAA